LLTRRRLTLPEGTIFIAHLANGIDNYQTVLLNYPAITWGRWLSNASVSSATVKTYILKFLHEFSSLTGPT